MLVTPQNVRQMKVVSRDKLKSISAPEELPKWKLSGRPDKSYWSSINHGVLADMIVTTLKILGFVIVSEKWILCMKQNLGLIADIEIRTDQNMRLYLFFPDSKIQELEAIQAAGMSMHILCRHSNNARWALHFLAASEVNICENGMVLGKFGSLEIRRRHSRFMGLRQYVNDSIIAVFSDFGSILNIKKQMESLFFSNAQGDSVIMEAGLRGIMPWRYIPDVAMQWRRPQHAAFQARNGWSLYNCFSEIAKKRSARDIVDTLADVKDLICFYFYNGSNQLQRTLSTTTTLTGLNEEDFVQLEGPKEDFFEELKLSDDDGEDFLNAFDKD